MSTNQGERNRDKVLQKLLRYVDEERWFEKRDFEAAAYEAGIGDHRTIWGIHGKGGYWNILQTLGVIETVQLRDGVTVGRLSRGAYDALEAHGTTLPVAADVRIIGRSKRNAQLISPEEMI